MSGMFENLVASDSEIKYQQREAANQLAAAVYDVRERFGSFLFAARDLEEYRDRLALIRDDAIRTMTPHVFPRSGVIRRVLKPLEAEFRAKLGADVDPSSPSGGLSVDSPFGGPGVPAPGMTMGGADEQAQAGTGTGAYAPGIPSDIQGPGKTPAGSIVQSVDPSRLHHDASRKNADSDRLHGPFAGYSGWEDCTRQNSNAADPDAYCGKIYHQVEDGRRRKGEPLRNFQDKQSSRHQAESYRGDGDVAKESGPFAGPHGSFPVGTEKDLNDAKSVCNMPSVHGKHPGTCDKIEDMSRPKAARVACWPGCHENEEHARKYHKEKESRVADKTGPAMNNDVTFRPSKGDLIPEGDFKGYLDRIDQGAREKVRDRFIDTESPVTEHTGDPADTDFAKSAAKFAAWCAQRRVRPSVDSLEVWAAKRPDREYYTVLAALRRKTDQPRKKKPASRREGEGHGAIVGLPPGQVRNPDPARRNKHPKAPDAVGAEEFGTGQGYLASRHSAEQSEDHPGHPRHQDPDWVQQGLSAEEWNRRGRPGWTTNNPHHQIGAGRRTAAPDYLQKADEALTQLLNQKAEEFQQGVGALQQALQIVQQEEQAMQAANPLNVQPPAGTVNVLPQPPAGMAQAGGGAPPPAAADQSGPAAAPPAAADQGAAPPDPQQLAASLREMVAMAMSRKHYVQMAKLVAGLPPEHKGPLAEGLADMFKADNDRFSHDKWYKAVGHTPQPAMAAVETMPQGPARAAKRGGRPKDDGAVRKEGGPDTQRTSGVIDDYYDWVDKSPGAPRGGESDIEAFANERGVGERAKSQLRQHLFGAQDQRKRGGDDPKAGRARA